MPQVQQYRLRLTEGTLLVVDHDALGSWLADEKALVQPPGSQRWRLLKQFLADERAGLVSYGGAYASERAAPPERPRLARGESARSQPAAPPPAVDLETETDEIFAPDLSESDLPWEWALESAPTAAPSPVEPSAVDAVFAEPVFVEPAVVAPALAEPAATEEPATDFEFPNDDALSLDDLVGPMETPQAMLSEESVALHAATSDLLSEPADAILPATIAPPPSPEAPLADLPAPIARRESVQVLADELVAVATAALCDVPSIALKPLDPEPEPAAVPLEILSAEEPLEATDWGPGLLGRFCASVADWSDVLADWLDRGRDVAERRQEYQSSVTTAVREVGPRLRARARAVPGETRSLLTAWRELIAGWWAQWRDRSRRP